MEEDFRAFLRTDDGVRVASGGGRVEWDERPQASGLPAVTLSLAVASPGYTQKGRDRLVPHLVQADCWGRTRKEAKVLARAVVAAADRLNAAPFASLRRAFVEAERGFREIAADGSTPVYRSSLDVRVWALIA
jgi:hypothetical protein